jgi:hypothetical protein
MDFLGLLKRYPAGHRVSESEVFRQLRQNQRHRVRPHYQLSVVEMNSTYLELVDKWFAWKGLLTLLSISIFAIFFGGIGVELVISIFATVRGASVGSQSFSLWNDVAMLTVLVCPPVLAAYWLAKAECFAYTHYPIRFDRVRRMVHVFRTDGTVMSESWDKIFFTLGHMPAWNDWEVRGYVLGSGMEVKETFALSYVGSMEEADKNSVGGDSSDADFVRAHWEFVRRYMEEGPQSVSDQIEFCMPVNNSRETIRNGFHRVFANFAGAPISVQLVMAPFLSLVGIARIIAMRTSRIPRWPDSLLSSCFIASGDPYAIEGAADGTRTAVYPAAALAEGVGFKRGEAFR